MAVSILYLIMSPSQQISKLSAIPTEFIDTMLIRETSFTVTSEILSDLHKQAWNTEPPDYLIDGKLVVFW